MKKLFVAFAVLLVLLAGALVVAALNLDSWLDENREELAGRAGDALGRKVAFEEIGVSFAGGFGIRLGGLSVGDDPAFSKEEFLSAGVVDVRVRILPALFGRVEVARVVLREPRVTVIQTARGLSTDSLGGGTSDSKPAASGGAEPAAAGPTVLVALVDLRDGTLRYVDRTAKPPVELTVTRLDFEASDLSVDRPLSFEMAAALLGSERQNLKADGTVGPVNAADPPLTLSLQLDPIPLEGKQVAAFVPPDLSASGNARLSLEAKGSLAKLAFEGRLDARDALLRFGETFEKPRGEPLEITLSGQRSADDVALDLAVRSPVGTLAGTPYRDLALDAALAGEVLIIEKLSLRAFDGELVSTGSYDMRNEKRPSFDLTTGLEGMRAEQLVASSSERASRFLSGELAAELTLQGAGRDWEEIKPGLRGKGNVRLVDGVVRDFNPAGETLRALAAIPAVAGSGIGRFAEKHPEIFGVGDTKFETLDGKLEIANGWVHARDFRLAARDYALSGEGRYSLDNALEMKTLLTLSESLSREILAADDKLRYLRNADGRVELPVALRGAPPSITAYPDVTHLARGASREAVTDLLGKALGGKKGEPGPAAEAPDGGEPAQQAPRAEDVGQELLRRGLEGLLGGQKRD